MYKNREKKGGTAQESYLSSTWLMDYQTIDLSNHNYDEILTFAGFNDCNLQALNKQFKTEFILRDQSLKYFAEKKDLLVVLKLFLMM